MDISRRMKALRETQGISLTELARQSGVSRAYLYLVENGDSQPTLRKLKPIATVLGVTLHDLLGNEEGELSAIETQIIDALRSQDYSLVMKLVSKHMKIP